LFDGRANEAEGIVIEVSRARARVKIRKVWRVERAAPNVILACSPVKSSRMNFLLEKSCELGVSEVWPIIYERTVVRMSAADWAKKGARWEKILLSAAKQSKRADVPVVLEPIELERVGNRLQDGDLPILCDREGLHPVEMSLGLPKRVVVFVGPEGGLTDDETDYILKTGAKRMSLGQNVLRTETACAAAVCIVSCATFNPNRDRSRGKR